MSASKSNGARRIMAEVYVAAGSNVEPETNLALALEELRQAFGELAVSPAYRNPPVGFAGADFINLVVGFSTADSPRQVKQRLERIEELCGRPRDAPKWASRTIDLDILMYDQLVSDEPGLLLPRPDLLRRAFMLKPLADLAQGLRHPTEQRTIGELWTQFAGDYSLVPVTIPRSGRHRPPGPGQ
jgi:2-amino-4-hydroxy-6-hydroxymethyldihydropteridine diphosphokinase